MAVRLSSKRARPEDGWGPENGWVGDPMRFLYADAEALLANADLREQLANFAVGQNRGWVQCEQSKAEMELELQAARNAAAACEESRQELQDFKSNAINPDEMLAVAAEIDAENAKQFTELQELLSAERERSEELEELLEEQLDEGDERWLERVREVRASERQRAQQELREIAAQRQNSVSAVMNLPWISSLSPARRQDVFDTLTFWGADGTRSGPLYVDASTQGS